MGRNTVTGNAYDALIYEIAQDEAQISDDNDAYLVYLVTIPDPATFSPARRELFDAVLLERDRVRPLRCPYAVVTTRSRGISVQDYSSEAMARRVYDTMCAVMDTHGYRAGYRASGDIA